MYGYKIEKTFTIFKTSYSSYSKFVFLVIEAYANKMTNEVIGSRRRASNYMPNK